MAAPASIHPRLLKRVLEVDGFAVEHEDDYNWALAKDNVDDVVLLPKHGQLVALDVQMKARDVAKMNDARLFGLLERAQQGL